MEPRSSPATVAAVHSTAGEPTSSPSAAADGAEVVPSRRRCRALHRWREPPNSTAVTAMIATMNTMARYGNKYGNDSVPPVNPSANPNLFYRHVHTMERIVEYVTMMTRDHSTSAKELKMTVSVLIKGNGPVTVSSSSGRSVTNNATDNFIDGYEDLTKKYENLTKKRNEDLAKLKKEKEDMEKEIRGLRERIKELEEQVTVSSSSGRSVTNNATDNFIDGVSKQIIGFQQHKTEINDLKRQNKELSKQNKELMDQYQELPSL
ncbi:hypothetical protein OsJ_13698 [Oryza sativa Japonica Group]|uniref:Uncharacterized protein n=1 Tax=Oryza sativa subsp. japonica TaxID=39947 RepID=B9FDI5_ORYSJ|nr:hypothetical protein OsJ_13698 [Oryza sativa Japonica Group]